MADVLKEEDNTTLVSNDINGVDQETGNLHDDPAFTELNKHQSIHSENITQNDKVALLEDEKDVDDKDLNDGADTNTDDGNVNKALSLDIGKTDLDKDENTELELSAFQKNESIQNGSNQSNDTATSEKEGNNTPFTVRKCPNKDKDDGIVYVASFDSTFNMLICALPVSPTKAWVYNFDKAKLVDLETAEIIKEYDATSVGCAFYHMKVVDENRIFFQDTADNTIKEMKVKNSAISLVSCDSKFSKNDILSFTLLKNGTLVACVKKEEGCLCFKKYAPYMQLYSAYGNFIRESKLEYNGSYLLQDAYDIVENNNGDLWIAGEKTKDSEWIVVLDENFKFRFTYEREEGFRFSATTLGVCPNNNVLAVIQKDQRSFVDVLDENGHFLRQLPVEHFGEDGSPTSVSVDKDGKAWIVTSIERIVCIQI